MILLDLAANLEFETIRTYWASYAPEKPRLQAPVEDRHGYQEGADEAPDESPNRQQDAVPTPVISKLMYQEEKWFGGDGVVDVNVG